MIKIVNVTSGATLPGAAFGKDLSGYTFNVLKEDSNNYLLEMPPGCGGHTSNSDVRAYWVGKSYCIKAYKAGQRWMYKNSLVVELLDDNPGPFAMTVQPSFGYTVGSSVNIRSMETSPEDWVYLRGQDKPTT
jgi:hypothetical protein